MPNPTNLLRRGRRIKPEELDATRSISLARLTAIFDDGTETAGEGAAPVEDAAATPQDGTAPAELVSSVDAVPPADAIEAETPVIETEAAAVEAETPVIETEAAAVEAETPVIETEAPVIAIDAMAAGEPAGKEPADAEADIHRNGHDAPLEIDATTAIAVNEDHDDAVGPTDPDGWDLPPVEVRAAASQLPSEALQVRDEPADGLPASPPSRPRRAAERAASSPRPPARPRAARPPRAKPVIDIPVAVIASCPYCALLLEPPPEADRRCARCRQRIIVKRVQGRAVYLTEAAVQVFDAERRRIANTGRWTRDRERWLKLAASVEASAVRIERLGRAVLSHEVVAAARALYETTVERKVRAARRDHRWDEAARLRRDEALALYRVAGSPVPPPDDVVALHREGALAALRGLWEIAKEAALVAADCCDSCRADDGRQFRISRELREPRLPHAGCPKGLCRCRWDLTVRDRNLVGDYLRRHVRSKSIAPSAEPR